MKGIKQYIQDGIAAQKFTVHTIKIVRTVVFFLLIHIHCDGQLFPVSEAGELTGQAINPSGSKEPGLLFYLSGEKDYYLAYVTIMILPFHRKFSNVISLSFNCQGCCIPELLSKIQETKIA